MKENISFNPNTGELIGNITKNNSKESTKTLQEKLEYELTCFLIEPKILSFPIKERKIEVNKTHIHCLWNNKFDMEKLSIQLKAIKACKDTNTCWSEIRVGYYKFPVLIIKTENFHKGIIHEKKDKKLAEYEKKSLHEFHLKFKMLPSNLQEFKNNIITILNNIVEIDKSY